MVLRPPSNPRQPQQPQQQPATTIPATPGPRKFGAPTAAPGFVQSQPAPPQPFYNPPSSVPATATAPAQQQGVDIFDIPQENFNPEAEAFETAMPAPPDDGDHLIQLTVSERAKEGEEIGAFTWKQRDGVERAGCGMNLVAEIIGQNDPHQGRRVFFYASTLSKNALTADGAHAGTTNEIAMILSALNVKPTGAPRPDAYRLKEMLPAVLVLTTQWEAQYPYDAKADEEAKAQGKKAQKKRPYKTGQQNFPVDDAGVPQPLYETPSGDPLRTVAVPIGYKRAAS